MNNFELHEKAQELADTKTAYSLARELILLQNSLQKIKAKAVREAKAYLLNNGFTYGAPYKLDELIEKLEKGEL